MKHGVSPLADECAGAEAVGGARGSRAAETQDAVAVHQQPHGGTAAATPAGGGPQADARGKPETGRRQPTLLAKRWQTRYVDTTSLHNHTHSYIKVYFDFRTSSYYGNF